MLSSLITLHGKKKWTYVSKKLNEQLHNGNQVRKARQCRERWTNHLDPLIVKEEWNLDEDLRLMEEQARLGNKWSTIAE